MDDVFDETSDDLTVARHDAQLIEASRYKDGFREGWESSEQDAFEIGFLRGYSLIAPLVFDYNFEKERFRLQHPSSSLWTKDIVEFDTEFLSIIGQLKIADEVNEEQQIETIKRLSLLFDELLVKMKFESMSI